MIRGVNIDVLVLALAAIQQLPTEEMLPAFALGKTFMYIPAHETAHDLGPEKCVVLFSGCDTVSCIDGHEKKSVWKLWNIFDEVTPAICILA